MRVEQTDQLNFDPFSGTFEYRYEILSTLMKAVPFVPNIQPVDGRVIQLDIGTGNGLGMQATKGIFEALVRRALLIGIDYDERALRVAAANTPATAKVKTLFIRGYAQDLDELLKGEIPEEGVDLLTYLDMIHEVPPQDQQGVISAGAAKLRPGGICVMNSYFTSIATNIRVGSRDYGMAWVFPTYRAATEFGGEPKEQAAILLRDPQEYSNMLVAAGLESVFEEPYHVSIVSVTSEARVGISYYPPFTQRVRDSYDFKTVPSLEEFAPVLAKHYGASSEPFPRKVVRYIYRRAA